MTAVDKRAVRLVLDEMENINTALSDVMVAMGNEDIVAAKMSLGHIIVGAEKAVNLLTTKEERDGT